MEVGVEDVLAVEGQNIFPEIVKGAFGLFLHARDESTFAGDGACLANSPLRIHDDLVAAGVEGGFDGGGLGGWFRLGRLEFEHSQFPSRDRRPRYVEFRAFPE